MIGLPPQGLQNALIFYFTCIIVVTSGFFGVVTLSRENVAFFQESFHKSVFLGRTLVGPARRFLTDGDPEDLRRVWEHRLGGLLQVRATVFDANWAPRWGDPPRRPEGPLPDLATLREMTILPGESGKSSRELIFPIASGGQVIGAVGIGVPEIYPFLRNESLVPVFFSMSVNILLGVGLAIFVAQIILRPLQDLLDGLEAVKRGDFSQRLAITGTGELAQLGEIFNLMVTSLQEKTREALERTRVLDEKVQELWEIYGLTKEMGFSLHLRQILERFLEKAQTLSFSSYGQILLYHPASQTLEAQVETPVFPCISREEYNGLLEKCLQRTEPIEATTRHHTFLLLPLMSGRLVQGILFLGKQGQQKYSEGIRRFLETIAPLGGSLIENARLYNHVVEMKDYVRHVLESVDSGVATLDQDRRLVTSNSSFRQLLGLADVPLDGRPLAEVLQQIGDPAFSERLSRAVSGAVSEEAVVTGELRAPGRFALHRPGCEPQVIQVRVHPLRAGEKVIGQVLVLDDLTRLEQIERRMQESEKWAVLGRLAASVAHEIRNPLVAIRGLAEFLGEELPAEQAGHVRVIVGEVDRLNKVVEQLLNLARPETTHLRRVLLRDLLNELLLLIRHEAARRQVEIRSEWWPEPVYVNIDPEKMKQAFLNVTLNALQAMERGGVLTIRMKMARSAGLPLLPTAAETVVIEFEDNGPGIPPEHLDQVFEPFFTTRPHGTGLGLAITRKILDLHQGRVTIDSAPGHGTRVRLALPVDSVAGHLEG